MTVYGFRKQGPGVMEIENSLEAKQDFVGGRVDVYAVTDYLDLVFNDAGLINGLEARAAVLGDGKRINEREILTVIYGDCFVCRNDGKGGFESIEESDIRTIRNHVKEVMPFGNTMIIIE